MCGCDSGAGVCICMCRLALPRALTHTQKAAFLTGRVPAAKHPTSSLLPTHYSLEETRSRLFVWITTLLLNPSGQV